MFYFAFSILSLSSLLSLFSSDLCCRHISLNQETLRPWPPIMLGSQFDLGLCVSLIYKLYWPSCVCSPRFSQSKADFSIFLLSWFLVLFSFSISLWMTWNMSFGRYVFLSIEMYCYRQDENIEIPLNHLLLTVRYGNISLLIWVYNKALINRNLGPYEKYLFWRSRRMDLTACGP